MNACIAFLLYGITLYFSYLFNFTESSIVYSCYTEFTKITRIAGEIICRMQSRERLHASL
jgi:hypothetical protein